MGKSLWSISFENAGYGDGGVEVPSGHVEDATAEFVDGRMGEWSICCCKHSGNSWYDRTR